MSKIELKNPIIVNGEEKNYFEYNLDQISEENLLHAIASCHFGSESFSALPENDSAFHMWLMFMAIENQNKEVDVMDLQEISGIDCYRLSKCGEDFFNLNDVAEGKVELDGTEYIVADDSLTAEMYIKADSESRKYANSIQKPAVFSVVNDMAFHLFLGYHIINVSNENISMEQLRNLKGGNLIKIMKIGRNFILEALVEDYTTKSQESNSEKSFEDTQEFTTAG